MIGADSKAKADIYLKDGNFDIQKSSKYIKLTPYFPSKKATKLNLVTMCLTVWQLQAIQMAAWAS